MPLYDAFISYSHAKDKLIASALQSAIQKLGKPWYQRRALRVFRDDTSLSATPHLWPTIRQALGESRYLILLASPEAAASPWVDKEIAYWLEAKSADTLLIAVTDGELIWDAGSTAFAAGSSLPPSASGRFTGEPKWVDLRAYRDRADRRDARFTELAADFAAAIHGTPKEDLLSQEVRQQRRALTLAWSAAGLLLILVGFASWQWWEAEGARRLAEKAQRATVEQKEIAEQQRDRAEQERGRAERNFAAAKQALFDIAEGFGGTDVLGVFQRMSSAIERLARTAPDDAGLQENQGELLLKFGRAFELRGDRKRALQHYEDALAIFSKLKSTDPANTKWRFGAAVSLGGVGNMKLPDDVAGALANYEESLIALRDLVATDPLNRQWQYELARRLNAMGSAKLNADPVAALAAQEESVAIMRRLVATDRDDLPSRQDLANSLIGNGLALMKVHPGEPSLAMPVFEDSLALLRDIVAANPVNLLQWQTTIATTLDRIGDLRLAGDPAKALKAYEEGLVLLKKLAAAYPANTKLQSGVAWLLVKVARANSSLEHKRAALREAQQIWIDLEARGALSPMEKGWLATLEAELARLSAPAARR
jgi:tetratricopeptide (TPR) repeat protein